MDVLTIGEVKTRLSMINRPFLELYYIPDSALIGYDKFDNMTRAIGEWEDRVVNVTSRAYCYHIGVTDHCNLRCPFCPTGKMDSHEKRGFISLDFYKRLVDQIADHAIVVSLSGWGEPTLHPQLIECIEYATERGIFTYLPTNFALRYSPDFFRRLVGSGLTRLHVDMDGMTQQTYEKYRVGGSLDVVTRNLKDLCRVNSAGKLAVEVAMIAMRHNQEEITKFKEFCKSMGIEECRVGKLQLHPGMHLDWLPDDPSLRYENYFGSEKPDACNRCYLNMVVRWDGGVPPCCLAYGKRCDFGDAKQGSLAEIWNNAAFRSARAVFLGENREPRTLCAFCRNDLGSPAISRYQDTFALFMPSQEGRRHTDGRTDHA